MSLSVRIDLIDSPARPGMAVVRGLVLDVSPGQVLTLMGASGSGKSSVLAAIAGTLAHADDRHGADAAGLRYQGRTLLDGQDITHWPTARRGIGLLFQDDLLFAHMTVLENLLFAVPPGPRSHRLAQAHAALAEAGLPDLGTRDPATLSGGQRARVALLRALLAQPRALLLDEPFSRLDAHRRAQFRAFVFEHLKARNIPAILVTHDAADVPDGGPVVSLEAAHAR